MSNLIPAGNVQAAAIAGATTVLIQYCLTLRGVTVPPDVASAITLLITVLVAHLSDILTGHTNDGPPKS